MTEWAGASERALRVARAAAWAQLAAECEAAQGADQALADRIRRQAGLDRTPLVDGPVTGSLDALLRLMAALLPDWDWGRYEDGTMYLRDTTQDSPERDYHRGRAPTPALALCAAICRTMAHRERR